MQILEIRDNGGETADRYTVIYTTKSGRYNDAVGMSEHPFHPQGFGQHCTAFTRFATSSASSFQ